MGFLVTNPPFFTHFSPRGSKGQGFQGEHHRATDAIEFQHCTEPRGRDPVVGGRRRPFRGGPQGPGVGVAEDVARALADAHRQGCAPLKGVEDRDVQGEFDVIPGLGLDGSDMF